MRVVESQTQAQSYLHLPDFIAQIFANIQLIFVNLRHIIYLLFICNIFNFQANVMSHNLGCVFQLAEGHEACVIFRGKLIVGTSAACASRSKI
jgi:hypothetical protein